MTENSRVWSSWRRSSSRSKYAYPSALLTGDDLFLFSSDYPHPEGGRDPIKRFDASLEGTSAEAIEKFYSGNFAEMMAMAPVSA